MHNEIKITDGLYYVGGSNRRLALFENVYPVPEGASYNSYLLLDEKTVLFDGVDESVSTVFFETIDHVLAGKPLDYIVIHHVEPDHGATIAEILLRHPEATLVTNAVAFRFLSNFFPKLSPKKLVVKEGDVLSVGKHELTFVTAQMVHWPEVMFTYEKTEKILFTADAFGAFGALNGDVFASEKNFDLSEARRYYANIVGKYGPQVLKVLEKVSKIDIAMICPLHGPVHKGNLKPLLTAYGKWASYNPEDKDGIMIAYNSVYGGTANVAMVLASKLVARGMRNVVVYDVSKTDSSYLIAESWRVGTILLVATTYNAGVFIKMEEFLHDLANHQLRNRNVGFIENGSWAPAAKANMKRILEKLEGFRPIEKEITIASRIKDSQEADLDIFADQVAAVVLPPKKDAPAPIDPVAGFKLSYGLFALFTKDESGKANASINNSFIQVSDKPNIYLLSVNVANYSAETIEKTGVFNLSILDRDTDFGLIKRFGFQSGRDTDKLAGLDGLGVALNGIPYLEKSSNAMLSCKVIGKEIIGNHVVFQVEVTEAKVLSNLPSLTYADYFASVKPEPLPQIAKAEPKKEKRVGWRCKICGYTYWGETLPADFVCPLCKHPASDFERIEE